MIIDLVDSHPIFLNMLGELLRQASTDFNVRIFGSLSKPDILIPKKCADLMILGVNAAPGSNEQSEYDNFRKQCPATKVIIYYENADSAAVYVDKGVDALISKTKDLAELIKCVHTVLGNSLPQDI